MLIPRREKLDLLFSPAAILPAKCDQTAPSFPVGTTTQFFHCVPYPYVRLTQRVAAVRAVFHAKLMFTRRLVQASGPAITYLNAPALRRARERRCHFIPTLTTISSTRRDPRFSPPPPCRFPPLSPRPQCSVRCVHAGNYFIGRGAERVICSALYSVADCSPPAGGRPPSDPQR